MSFQLNFQTCNKCEHRQKDCRKVCLCAVDKKDILHHAERATCPLGKHAGREFTPDTADVDFIVDEPPNPNRPLGWRQWENVRAAYLKTCRIIASYVPVYPAEKHAGRGIATCAGGRYFPIALASIKILRRIGCVLPVEIWHLPDEVIEPWMSEAVKGLGCVFRTSRDMRINGGWNLKARAILESGFAEVIYLDADCYPVTDPSDFFSKPEFLDKGCIWFPDPPRFNLLPEVWKIMGLEHEDTATFESGMAVVDVRKSWGALVVADWLCQHGDYYFGLGKAQEHTVDGWRGQYPWGDKDMFFLAYRLTRTPYHLVERPYDTREPAAVHFDTDLKTPRFIHRISGKGVFDEAAFPAAIAPDAQRNNGIPNEDLYWSAVEEVKKVMPVVVPTHTPSPASKIKQKPKGLGDVIEGVLDAVGLGSVPAIYRRITGKDCGCHGRRDKLNQLFPM